MIEIFLDMMSHYGLKEIDGAESNPEILAMFKELGYTVADDSTTAWCSASLSYFAKKHGYEYHKGLDARGWLKMPLMKLKPQMGDVVVLWRETEDSWKGHVGLFVSWNDKYVFILGGNQGSQINITAYPRDRVLGFRELKKAKV